MHTYMRTHVQQVSSSTAGISRSAAMRIQEAAAPQYFRGQQPDLPARKRVAGPMPKWQEKVK